MLSFYIDIALTALLLIVAIVSISFSIKTIISNKSDFLKYKEYNKFKSIVKRFLLRNNQLKICLFKPKEFFSTQHNYGIDPEKYNEKIDIKLLENSTFTMYMKRK